jgi:DNA (cytosine-5)-methyltransferase 1
MKENDKSEISDLINKLKIEHGCQLIINGLLATMNYYLRLIASLEAFMTNYNNLLENDTEIKKIHKEKWNELTDKYLK